MEKHVNEPLILFDILSVFYSFKKINWYKQKECWS